MRISASGPGAFSKRESFDCDASSAPPHRVPAGQKLASRILGESRRIVALMPAGDAEQSLTNELR